MFWTKFVYKLTTSKLNLCFFVLVAVLMYFHFNHCRFPNHFFLNTEACTGWTGPPSERGVHLGEWSRGSNYSHSIIEVCKQSPATLSPYLPRKSLPCGFYLGEQTPEGNYYSQSIIEVCKQSPAILSPYLPRKSAPLPPLWALPWRMDTRKKLFTQHY